MIELEDDNSPKKIIIKTVNEYFQKQIQEVNQMNDIKWFQVEDVRDEDLNTISEIIPGRLYLTNKKQAQNEQKLADLQITHILNISSTIKQFETKYTYYCIGCIIDNDADARTFKLFLPDIADFIHNAILSDKKVLVHCAAGISRSVTAVIGYLILKWNLQLKYAFKICKKLRPATWPNQGFLDMLMGVEYEVFGKQTLQRIVSCIDEC